MVIFHNYVCLPEANLKQKLRTAQKDKSRLPDQPHFFKMWCSSPLSKKNMWQAKCLHRICLPADRIPNKHRIQSNCMVAVGLPLVAQLWKKSRLSQTWLVGGFHHPGRKYQSVGIFIQGFFTLKPCLKPPGAVDAADHHLHKKLPYKLR